MATVSSTPDLPDDDALQPAAVVAGPSPNVLRAITSERVGLALWWRSLCPRAEKVAEELLDEAPFCHNVTGSPGEAAIGLTSLLPPAARLLQNDFTFLAALFADLATTSTVNLGLEYGQERTWSRLHVSPIAFRMLCTYAGYGIEWQDARGTVRRMPNGHVAVFKGPQTSGHHVHVRHRSPCVANLSPRHRKRLLLRIEVPLLN